MVAQRVRHRWQLQSWHIALQAAVSLVLRGGSGELANRSVAVSAGYVWHSGVDTPAKKPAALSCAVLLCVQIMLAQKLKDPLKQLQDTALSIAAMQRDAGLECDDEVYLDSFKPTLMDVFYDWSLGKSFADVSEHSCVPQCGVLWRR